MYKKQISDNNQTIVVTPTVYINKINLYLKLPCLAILLFLFNYLYKCGFSYCDLSGLA